MPWVLFVLIVLIDHVYRYVVFEIRLLINWMLYSIQMHHICCRVLKSEFIRAKYSRLEFKTPNMPTGYNCPVKEGIMLKKGRDDKKFQKRKFILSRDSNTLTYYAKENVSAAHVCAVNRGLSIIRIFIYVKCLWILYISIYY